MSGTTALATLENTVPVNSLMPSVFIMRSAICFALTGLQAVVFDNKLNRNAAELAVFGIDRELEGIADDPDRDSHRDRTMW